MREEGRGMSLVLSQAAVVSKTEMPPLERHAAATLA
jgi:hypothetical protein